jgi:Mn2+/Fe2+ NRAMP family transporter
MAGRLARAPLEAKAFYATLVIAALAGIAANFAGVDAIGALYWSAVINGIVATPVLVMMMWIAAHPRIMSDFVIGVPLRVGGWIATAIVAAGVAAMGGAAVLEIVS